MLWTVFTNYWNVYRIFKLICFLFNFPKIHCFAETFRYSYGDNSKTDKSVNYLIQKTTCTTVSHENYAMYSSLPDPLYVIFPVRAHVAKLQDRLCITVNARL